jgi:sugar/nucleoside kinase (ribokinase family)
MCFPAAFMSDERLPLPADAWLEQVMDRWPCRIAIVGQGARGAAMAVRGDSDLHHVPAVDVGPVASTLGADDALCAGFLDGYARGLLPRMTLFRAPSSPPLKSARSVAPRDCSAAAISTSSAHRPRPHAHRV